MMKKLLFIAVFSVIFIFTAFTEVSAYSDTKAQSHESFGALAEPRLSAGSTSTEDKPTSPTPLAQENLSPDAVTAAIVERRYIITKGVGTLVLSEYISGTPHEVARGELSELILSIPSGAHLTLDGITADSTELSGSYTITGSFTLGKGGVLTLGEGCQASFTDTVINLASGALIRVKGAKVRLSDCSVTAEKSAFSIDMHADSELMLEDTTLNASTDGAAIEHKRGKLILLNSAITNTLGAAVNSTSTLYLAGDSKLSGVGYDLICSAEVMLSGAYGEYTPSSVTEVCRPENFALGSAHILFHGATAAHLGLFNLYDTDGRAVTLSYFPSADFTDERSFIAVYLPYTVRYYGREGLLHTEHRLAGERIQGFAYSPSKGYTAVGWYLDREGDERYSQEAPVTCDLDLYLKERLTPPEFSLSSVSKVYDGSEETLAFSSVTHPLDGDGGMYFYRWFKDGVEISSASSLKVCSVSDSGIYSCIITYSYRSDTVSVTAENITVSIAKRSVEVPEARSVIYDGLPHSPSVNPSSLYSLEATPYTDAGEYSIALTLTDSANYRWETTDNKIVEIPFTITKAENCWSEEIRVNDIYYGAEIGVVAKARFGSVRLLFSREKEGEYSETTPTALGVYYVIAVVDGTDNYSALCSEPHSFEVMREYAVSLDVLTMPDKCSYKAFESFSPYGLTLSVTYNSGRVETVGAERISYKYQRSDRFLADDSAVILSYGGISTMLPVDVSAAEYDLASLVFRDTERVYSARFISIDKPSVTVIGEDGIPLGMTVIGGGCDRGDYTVTLRFSTDSTNYLTPGDITAKLTILPFTTEITWQNTEFVYDGSLKLPIAEYRDVYGATRYATVVGGRTEAGEGYLATAIPDSDNYFYVGADTEFSILRADYDLSGVYWTGGPFTYDGCQKAVGIHGLPDSITLVGYTDNCATTAGEYTATAAISYDERNYNKPPTLSYTWSIARASYPTDSYSFSSATHIYDGTTHYPIFTGKMPTGLDGSTLSYSFSGGATHVSDGCVTVIVGFATESSNYLTPDPITLTVTILPKPIEVGWNYTDAVYDGNPHGPTAESLYTPIRVTGFAINAGEYTATATAIDADYTVSNPEFIFVISKAENFFTTPPTVADVFLGRSPAPIAEAHFGTPIFSYWLDDGCSLPASLDSHGRVYLLATVPESENYLPLVSVPIAFEIIEVIPVGISVEITADRIVAFSPLTEGDYIAYLCYNDGTRTPIMDRAVRVIYQSADSPRRTDSRVDFEYLTFTASVAVSVDYADYDTSGVTWSGISHTYDGTPKHPTLSGLPKGVSLTALTREGATDVGSYTYGAILAYDSLNYNPPTVPDCTLTIHPAIIPIPTVQDRVYNAQPYIPSPTDSRVLYEARGGTNSGRYTLTATLADLRNYRFEGGAVSCSVSYSILPAPITVEVPPYDLYLWESIGASGYTVTSGGVLEGDSVNFSESNDGSFISILSDNPNYVVYTVGGEIIRHDRLSPRAVSLLFLLTVTLLLLLLLFVILILHRDRILDALAAFRSRRNLGKAAASPTAHHGQRGEAVTHTTSPPIEEPEALPNDPHSTATPDDSAHTSEDVSADTYSDSLALSEIIPPDPIDCLRADNLITDALAKDLVRRSREAIVTSGNRREIINVDTLSDSFSPCDRVDVNILKDKSLVPSDTAYIKVLARGFIDKPLKVYANDFSLSAVKMIALTGGEAIRVNTLGDDTHEPFDDSADY